MRRANDLAEHLREHARDEQDLSAAKLLEDLGRVYDAARDSVMAKTHQQSIAAYQELIDIFRGKND